MVMATLNIREEGLGNPSLISQVWSAQKAHHKHDCRLVLICGDDHYITLIEQPDLFFTGRGALKFWPILNVIASTV
jgi:hypothetical protein